MKSAVVAAVPEQFQNNGFTGIERDAELSWSPGWLITPWIGRSMVRRPLVLMSPPNSSGWSA